MGFFDWLFGGKPAKPTKPRSINVEENKEIKNENNKEEN